MATLTAKNLAKAYKGRRVVEDVSLTVNSGEIVGLLGPNGAGKTTLLHMMLGMYDKMKGKIYIDGLDVVKNKTKVKELVGIVSQDRKFYLSQDANGNEKIYSPFYKNWDSEEYHRMLAHLELSPRRRLCSFSTGEMIKYQFAFAAAYRPKVLLMDEPTSALDPISTSKIEDLAMELKKDYTIVMVTHNMQQAVRVSDNTAFFLLGEVIEYNDTEKLFSIPEDKRTEDYITGRFG